MEAVERGDAGAISEGLERGSSSGRDRKNQEELAAFAISTQGLTALTAGLRNATALPGALCDFLFEEIPMGSARASRLRETLLQTVRTLRSAGVEVVALKGATLAFFHYPDPALRPMGDLDLLLHDPRDLARATEALAGAGWRALFDTPRHRVFARPDERIARPAAEDPDNPIRVEIHTSFRIPILGRVYDASAELRTEAESRDLGGIPVSIAAGPALLQHLLFHAAEDFAGNGIRGIQAHDFRLLARKEGTPLAPEELGILATSETSSNGIERRPAHGVAPLLYAADAIERLFPLTFKEIFLSSLSSRVSPILRARAAALPALRYTRPARGWTRTLLTLVDAPLPKARFLGRIFFPTLGEVKANAAPGASGLALAVAWLHVFARRLAAPLRPGHLVVLPVLCALLLLLPRLDWGFLSTAPGVPVVQTAEPDERHLVEGLLRMSFVPFRPDPVDRSWGGLSFTLLFALVSLVDATGAFAGGWRAALLSGDLSRAAPVLLTLRASSVLAVLACMGAAYLLTRRRRGAGAGLFAAALVAVSPAMVLSGRTYVTDALQTALVALAFLPASPALAGLLMGLAIGTKYSAAAFVPALVWSVPAGRRRALLWSLPLGYALGAPFVVRHARSSARLLLVHLRGVHGGTWPSAAEVFEMWRSHASSAALYLVGPVGLVLAFAALARRWSAERALEGRRTLPGAATGVPALLLLGQLAWLAVSNFPVVRYQLPIVPFLAAWAAEGLVDATPRRGRGALAAAALALSAALSALLVFGVPRVHPFERAGLLIRGAAPPGARVGRIWFGMPQLPGLAPEELKAFPNLGVPAEEPSQDLVVDDDLPPIDFAPAYRAGRDRDYEALGSFGGAPRLFGFAWPRALTPHDARYPSPRVTVWRRREGTAGLRGPRGPSARDSEGATAPPGHLPTP